MDFNYLNRISAESIEDLMKRDKGELALLVHSFAGFLYDSLTGLRTRAGFFEGVEEIAHNTSFVLFDVDYFKKINDSYGHLMGDEVLKQVGAVMVSNSRCENGRDADLVRYGGEEFLAILPNTPIVEAELYADRIRCQVNSSEFFASSTEKFKVTLSAGVSHFDRDYDPSKSPHRLLREADIALYAAKNSGRNKVCSFLGK